MSLATLIDLSGSDDLSDRRKSLIKFGILKERLLAAFAAVDTRIDFTDVITSLIIFF